MGSIHMSTYVMFVGLGVRPHREHIKLYGVVVGYWGLAMGSVFDWCARTHTTHTPSCMGVGLIHTYFYSWCHIHWFLHVASKCFLKAFIEDTFASLF